jgi:hypothetical protein
VPRDVLRIQGTPGPTPRSLRGPCALELGRAWADSWLAITGLPRFRVTDGDEVAARKIREIRESVAAWHGLKRAITGHFWGRIQQFSPQYPHLLVGIDPRILSIESAVRGGGWAPPGGFQDLVLVAGTTVLAWTHTHDTLSVIPARYLDENRGGASPSFSAYVQVQAESLGSSVLEKLC